MSVPLDILIFRMIKAYLRSSSLRKSALRVQILDFYIIDYFRRFFLFASFIAFLSALIYLYLFME